MEPLSRPFHSRKLSNASTFSGKNAYDGVFSGPRPKHGRGPAANVEDYREIFGSAQAASSIPVLDLSTLEESSDGSNLELGNSKPDYGKIFGGFRDEDVAVSYEELLACDKARAPSSTIPSSQDVDDLSHQPFDALKQFNMSYHKISQRSKDGLDGTTHVTQLHAVPGFTCFVDETASRPKKETKKQKSSVTNNVHPSIDSSKTDFPEKQTSGSAVKSRSKYHQDESLSDDRILKTFEADLKSHPSKVSSSPSASETKVDNHKDYKKRSTATNTGSSKSHTPGVFSPTYFDEELDVNSAAAASAAALKKAIENAQESIRIAKESVGRKKEGLRSFSSKSFKDSLKVKARPENVSAGQEQKGKDNEVKVTFERVAAASQVFPNMGTNHKYGGTVVFRDFADGEKLFGAKKVIDKIHGKILESAKKSEMPIRSSHEYRDSKIVCNSKEVAGETEGIDLDSVGRCEYATGSSEAVENNTYEAPQENKAYAHRPKGFLVLKGCEKELEETEDAIEDDRPRESKENMDEERLSNAHKLIEGSNDLTVYLKEEDDERISQGSNQNGYQNRLNEAFGLLENEKQEVLEQEHVEKIENAETHDPNGNDEASEKGLENEKELKDYDDTETHKEEDISEKFYDVCELEMNENAQTYAYRLGKSEVSPKEDCEMKEKENHEGEETWKRLDEVHGLEIYENSSSDYDDAEESESACSSHCASNILTDTQEAGKVGLRDNNMGSSQDVDGVSSSSGQVTGASYEFQVEETEAIEAECRSEEKEIFEKISVDQTAPEDNEEECDAKADNLLNFGLADMDFGQNETEQNDVRSEASLDTVLGMEIEVNEYKERNEIGKETMVNLQPYHEERPKIRSEKETGASQEPKVSIEVEGIVDVNEDTITSHYRENKDEIRETGPSKVVGKEPHKRIEEAAAGERERERNRLAVERAIREARERAFAEARERAERAAVERATAEVQQRVMADAQEKVAKASVGTKPSDRTSAESKLRAERAAVERATSEARQRALQKAMSQKNISETRALANEIRQTSSSVSQNSLQDLRSSNGKGAESAQRRKAKLEKHNRIMERAAKALAEKEKRDLLAQKEQAERSRLAENLDADIKRWSNGKEGNLRALLSTLQYILGAESGWQPVSLTEIITTSAVKKAYRKATLCVHPDKLQQRGASIQQKYICEKVFDLLKAAWNRFNSEER